MNAGERSQETRGGIQNPSSVARAMEDKESRIQNERGGIPISEFSMGQNGFPPPCIHNSVFRAPRSTFLLADWRDVVFFHFRVNASDLQRAIPFPLETLDGQAYVSLVAFTQVNFRLAFGGGLTSWLSRPIARHEFLNFRTYVSHERESGVYFIAEWVTNRLSALLAPACFGLPYRMGNVRYEHGHADGRLRGEARGSGRFAYEGKVESAAPHPSERGGLDEFLVERYTAYTDFRGWKRRFRIQHEPWNWSRVEADVTDRSLVDEAFPWFRDAKLVCAQHSHGLRGVRIGLPNFIGVTARGGGPT